MSHWLSALIASGLMAGGAIMGVVASFIKLRWKEGFPVLSQHQAEGALGEWLALGARLVHPGGRVLGMEARAQIELGPNDARHVYELADRQRAVIVRRVP